MSQNLPNENTPKALTSEERRELIRKMGKFAAYAAPFAILANTNKAQAASGGGPRRGPRR